VQDARGKQIAAALELGGSEYRATWYLPPRDAPALVLMQHGFNRSCHNLRESSRQLMGAGLLVLCLDASMAGGNPALAEALATRLAGGLSAPEGRVLPQRIVVGGHSAGARFAVSVGARLDALAPQRLAGALLFDPVATPGFEAQLLRISDAGRRPVLAVMAPAHDCNALHNALPALREVQREARRADRDAFVGVQLGDDATHVDVEGEDGDWLGNTACGQPTAANVALLRALAVRWALDMAQGPPPRPPAAGGWRDID
jgi:dienelactone hydrolase